MRRHSLFKPLATVTMAALLLGGAALAQTAAPEATPPPAAAAAAPAAPAPAPAPAADAKKEHSGNKELIDKMGEKPAAAMSDLRVGLDTVWVLVAGMLVFWMNAGFALVESGLCQSKNCVNILFKNFIVFAISTLSFWMWGWDIMFADGTTPWMASLGSFFVGGADNSPALAWDAAGTYSGMNPFSLTAYEGIYSAIAWTPTPLWAKFFFQLVFAGTAATIVSGAVAERIKFHTFMIFSFILVAIIYPISGHWIWGGGILGMTPDDVHNFFGNFRDFAGSTVVHSVGGWAALAGVIVLGPRLAKFKDGKINAIPGHNMTSAALGVLILWLGWFGFNPGSTMAAMNGSAISHVLVNTNIAAATGAIGSLITAWILLKKPDLSMVLNGCLAGLVAITAPCAFVTIQSGAVIGFIGGVIVVLAVLFFDKVRLDDPVGALSVHLVNGVWGTLALGLFYDGYAGYVAKGMSEADAKAKAIANTVAALDTGLTAAAQTMQQIKGILLVGGVVFVLSLVVWFIIKAIFGLRVTAEEETEGLDLGEHGNVAYPDFQSSTHG